MVCSRAEVGRRRSCNVILLCTLGFLAVQPASFSAAWRRESHRGTGLARRASKQDAEGFEGFGLHGAVLTASSAVLGPTLDGMAHGNFGVTSLYRAAYACAVLHFWTARIRNWRGRQPLKAETMADEKVLARVHDKRQRTLKAIANLWCLVLDIFLAALFVSQLWSTSVSSIKTLPLFVGVAGGNVILHRLCRPDLKLTPERPSA
eukprot:s541_g13.t1